MRKTKGTRPRYLCCAITCLLALAAPSAGSQEATPVVKPSTPPAAASAAAPAAVATQPTDPKEMLRQAAKLNGLSGSDVKPWHSQASYTLFDPDGGVKHRWALDESWVDSSRFQRKTGVETANGSTVWEIQRFDTDVEYPEPDWPLGLLTSMSLGVFDPSVHSEMLRLFNVRVQQRLEDGAPRRCFDLLIPNHPEYEAAGDYYSYCFDPQGILTSISEGKTSLLVSLSAPTKYGARTVPSEVEVHLSGKLVVTGHLDSLEQLSKEEASGIQPMNSSTASLTTVQNRKPSIAMISPELANTLLVKRVDPVYPPTANDAEENIEGDVVLRVMISKTGTIAWATIVSGERVFGPAALGAIRQWQYKPYLLNGEPVEFQTTVKVHFSPQ